MISPSLALGNFDGVHTAHKALISRAKAHGGRCAVFTFDTLCPPYITSPGERLEIFRELGVDAVYLCSFEKVKNMEYGDFFIQILSERIGAGALFCGFNYTFGKGAQGKAADLVRLCRDRNIFCSVMESYSLGGQTVSSSAVRHSLTEGEPEKAELMLGRPFSLSGTVIKGKGLGGKLGFPTLNITVDKGYVPLKKGVYFTRCEVEGRVFSAISDYGIRPTFNDGTLTLESFLLDTEGDFYGKQVRVEFLRFCREEQRFDSSEQLSNAVMSDIDKAKDYFNVT